MKRIYNKKPDIESMLRGLEIKSEKSHDDISSLSLNVIVAIQIAYLTSLSYFMDLSDPLISAVTLIT